MIRLRGHTSYRQNTKTNFVLPRSVWQQICQTIKIVYTRSNLSCCCYLSVNRSNVLYVHARELRRQIVWRCAVYILHVRHDKLNRRCVLHYTGVLASRVRMCVCMCIASLARKTDRVFARSVTDATDRIPRLYTRASMAERVEANGNPSTATLFFPSLSLSPRWRD